MTRGSGLGAGGDGCLVLAVFEETWDVGEVDDFAAERVGRGEDRSSV